LTSSHHSVIPAGSREVAAKPSFWLGFSNTRFWPPEELLFSLAHVEALYHLSLFLLLSPPTPPTFPPVRSVFTGACKMTWQEQLNALDRTDVPGDPQTLPNLFFLPSLSLKEFTEKRSPLCARGSSITEFVAKLQARYKYMNPIPNLLSNNSYYI